jgi:soluble lytic murein transglycosylase-like protein
VFEEEEEEMKKRNEFTSGEKDRSWRAAAVFCVIALLLSARPAAAADLAILRNGFSIRHERHVVMGATTRLYLGSDDANFMDVLTADITGYEKDLSPAPVLSAPLSTSSHSSLSTPDSMTLNIATGSVKFDSAKSALALTDVVNSASATYHLDPDLVNSVIHAESGFKTNAVSRKGARGLMQLMPGTATQLGVTDALNPQDNVTGGSRYLHELLERYNFDLVKALAAYNAGPGRVEQYQGVPPFRETRAYVARIVHDYNKKKIAQEKEAKRLEALNHPPPRIPNRVPEKVPNKMPHNVSSHAPHSSKPATEAVAAATTR